jgi:uncharacterized protein YegP (UPF0339 family)
MANPKYQLKNSSSTQVYWVLFAKNGEPILKSEMYNSKQGAMVGIHSSKNNVADRNFDKRTAVNDQYYFNQVATNGEIIGTSETYTTTASRDNGIASVKRDAPVATIEDATVNAY